MNKGTIAIFCFILNTCISFGQVNLVPNPSFEVAVTCPTVLSMLSVANWSSFSNSPDYFNSCSTASTCGSPNNGFGHQIAATGNAYCGFLNIWPGVGGREYLGAKLIQPLVTGKRYFLSMKVCLAERWFSNVNAPLFIPSNKCGMKFSTNPFSVQNPLTPNNQAALYSTAIISDTTNWVTLTGVFLADSSYQYVVLGNFFKDNQTDTIARPMGFDSYFYVDDIVVSSDSTLVVTDINDQPKSKNDLIRIVNGQVSIETNNMKKTEVFISSITGTIVYYKIIEEGEELQLSEIPAGVYLVNLFINGVVEERKKVLINNE